MHYLPKYGSLIACTLLVALASCRVHDDQPAPETRFDTEGVKMLSSEVINDLHQLDTAHLTAAGEGITDPTAVTWYVENKKVGQGKTFVFSERLPGSYEVILRQGNKGLAKTITVRPRFTQGMFLLNEGNYGNETGTLTYIDLSKQFVLDSAYQRINPKHKLGNVAEDLVFANGKIYIIGQRVENGAEGLLTIVKQESLERLHVLNDKALAALTPTHIAVVGDLIYLRTDNGGIVVGSETGGFEKIPGTEKAKKMRMVTLGQRVYAISETNKIIVLQGKQLIATFTLPQGELSSIAPTEDGNLWLAYQKPNTLAKLSSDPRELKILAAHAVSQSLDGGWGAASIIVPYGDKIFFAEQNRKVYVHDFKDSSTKLFFDFQQVDTGDFMKMYYNSLGVDAQGNVYFAGINDWGTYKEKNRFAVIIGKTQSLALTKDKMNPFPAGFFPIPTKK